MSGADNKQAEIDTLIVERQRVLVDAHAEAAEITQRIAGLMCKPKADLKAPKSAAAGATAVDKSNWRPGPYPCDIVPRYVAQLDGDAYRDIEFMRAQCASMAKQLQGMAS